MVARLHLRAPLLAACLAPLPGSAADAQRPAQSCPTARDETADRVAIEQLTIEYSYLLDHGRATELAALFTPDGVFDNPNSGTRQVGRAAIAAYYARRAADPRTTRHVSTNLRIVFETPDRAAGTRLITYYRGDGATPPFPNKPGSVGEYSETYQRGGDGCWRFASRVNRIIFSGSGQPAEK